MLSFLSGGLPCIGIARPASYGRIRRGMPTLGEFSPSGAAVDSGVVDESNGSAAVGNDRVIPAVPSRTKSLTHPGLGHVESLVRLRRSPQHRRTSCVTAPAPNVIIYRLPGIDPGSTCQPWIREFRCQPPCGQRFSRTSRKVAGRGSGTGPSRPSGEAGPASTAAWWRLTGGWPPLRSAQQ
ncbi:hypothetical protein Strop_2626 [Salinispora tropica CNB-440]|uniref:Uncharacterized protein n=1 Tax=Salinispora tropica (strain ATCC BAA-916 / DSM 44818 / JCM 13857 / NBRC 105044 / CNB-440) TaxID=369723 RepID=A4X870_SALTO|nr:hypothetical protein Strop_2626 [Salinispora tropica CNB-440]